MKVDDFSRPDGCSSVTSSSDKSRLWSVCQLLPALSLLIAGLLIFRKFLFGGAVLLYKDIGSDSLNVFYPYLVHLSDYIRLEGLPSWSFHVGMGQSLSYFTGYLIWQPIIWLSRELIPRALVFQHLFKILIAGLLFLRFLQLRGLNFPASLLGSFCLSFSAYMCMGSCWYTLADEVICFTFLLFAVEMAVTERRWIYMPLAIALASLVSVFHLYLSALLLCFYVSGRLLERFSWQPRAILRTCISLAATAALGLGVVAITSVSNFYALLNSPRGSGTTSLATALRSFPVFGLESRLHYITASLRPFANDILGTGSDFRGWRNYLEAPMTYCGLFCLLIFPQVFIKTNWPRRIFYALFLGSVVVGTVFPWFRYLFWAFQGDYYRTFSLFTIIGVVTFSMTAFSGYIKDRDLNLGILVATTFALLAILYLPLSELQAVINPSLRRVATILFIGYTLLLTIGQLLKRQRIAAWMILGLAIVELFYFDGITVASRPTVTKHELSERVGYNDQTIDAVRDIKASDESFFRISKTWGSGPAIHRSLNDAMVFGYYGTSSYSSFNNLNYIRFLLAVDAIDPSNWATETKWSNGLVRYPLLSTFACEKYLLTLDPVPFQMANQYEFVKRYGTIYLFRNTEFLPFGLSFSRYIDQDLFLKLPTTEKVRALLHSVVLSEKEAATLRGLSQMTIDRLHESISSTPAEDVIVERRASAFGIRSFSQTRIDGTIRLDRPSVLVFQTPFDLGWHAFVDGKPGAVLKVDIGLLGLPLETGEHQIELRYRPPFFYVGLPLSVISLAILGFALWRWPRLRLPRLGKRG